MKQMKINCYVTTTHNLPHRKKPYSGEVYCCDKLKNGKACKILAYYWFENGPRCGRHSDKGNRHELAKNPHKAEIRERMITSWEENAGINAEENRKNKTIGRIICKKMIIFGKPEPEFGFKMVFPNNRHGQRKDGFGCPELSPMRLGPINHGQPGLPPALTLENYHQFNKCFPNEVNENGDPLPEFYERRRNAYVDPTPHRHKFDTKIHLGMNSATNGKNIPLYSIHLNTKGEEKRFSYVQSRWFYAHQYEILATKKKEFETLKKMMFDGFNLQIMDFDGYSVTESLYNHYCDATRPFGHGMCLLTLLTVYDPQDYPWNQYRRKYSEIYD